MNMNRPKFCNYWSDGLVTHDSDYKDYIDEIEKYCDHLEKALDNACELLEEYSTYDDPTPKDEWKKELLND